MIRRNMTWKIRLLVCLVLLVAPCWSSFTAQCEAPTTLENGPAFECDDDCQRETVEALLGIYNKLNGSHWGGSTRNWHWNVHDSCGDEVPSYCCWKGVKCCCHGCWTSCYGCDYINSVRELSIRMAGATGTLTSIMEELEVLGRYGLMGLDLSNNRLVEGLPGDLNKLTNLSSLELGGNEFRGSIPNLSQLTRLELLNLEYNQLQGRLSENLLCDEERNSSLERLYLRGNRLEGQIRLSNCSKLVLIDLQDNQFSGTLPVSYLWINQLQTLKLDNNFVGGDIPVDFYNISSLNYVSLKNNKITGSIAKEIAMLSYVSYLDLSGNNLSGILPPELFTLQQLTSLFLSGNPFVQGSIPASVGGAKSLETLELQETRISGIIPSELNQLPHLSNVDLRNTQLSCCTEENVSLTDNNANLPRFLKFDPEAMVQPPWHHRRPNWTVVGEHMRCPMIVRNSFGLSDTRLQYDNWKIDPNYYWFRGCVCFPGYSNISNMYKVLICQKNASVGSRQNLAKDISIAVLAALLLSILLAALLFRYLIQNKHAILWMRNMAAVEKRLKGMPRSGRMSVVVTDIEGYSTMMKETPDLMQSALNQHNSILRRCKRDNSGYTAEQEGDSFTMLFYDPVDAVMFCLQAQQALMKASWPEGLGKRSSADLSSDDGDQSRIRRRHSRRDALLFLGRTLEQAYSSLTSAGREAREMARLKGGLKEALAPEPCNSAFLGDCPQVDQGPSQNWTGLGLGVASSSSKARTEEQLIRSDASGNNLRQLGNPGSGSSQSGQSQVSGGLVSAKLKMFNGLRVRMGVATGVVEPQEEIKGSAVWERAKVVSDMAQGGQVLMDVWTWDSVRDLGADLAAVDSNGFNVNKLAGRGQLLKRLYKHLRKNLMTRLGRVEEESWRRVSPEREVTMLDMGEYAFPGDAIQPSPCTLLPALSEGSSWPYPRLPQTDSASSCGPPLTGHVLPSVLAECCGTLRTWQVLSPPLVGRAKTFGSTLNLKEGALKIDAPYFDAPGTSVARLDCSEPSLRMGHSGSPPLPLLPYVTTVFCCVEDAKKLRRKRVHGLLSMCIRDALSMVPGGYLCREQEGELKYMLTFSCSSSALLFCLSVQSASMYVNWPAHLDLREQWDDKRGRWVFRGPRLKMGVCEGHPTSILPDHVGRADYHGECINMAARFMDAAAHGGQVVCDKSLALEVLEQWRKANERDLGKNEDLLLERAEKGMDAEASCVHSLQPIGAGCDWVPLAPQSLELPCMNNQSCARHDGAVHSCAGNDEGNEVQGRHEEPAGPPMKLRRSSLSDTVCCRSKEEVRKDNSLERPSLPSNLDDVERTQGCLALEIHDGNVHQSAFALPETGLNRKDSYSISASEERAAPDDRAPRRPSPFANPLQSKEVMKLLQGHACIEEVGVYSVGDFRFKGSLNTLTMVNVMLTSLSARRFPQEAPKGKGSCIRRADRLLAASHVVLPNLTTLYVMRMRGSGARWKQPGLEPLLRCQSSPAGNLTADTKYGDTSRHNDNGNPEGSLQRNGDDCG